MNDLSKLPKWAQSHIAVQSMRIEELTAKLDGMLKPCKPGEALLAIEGEDVLSDSRALPTDAVEINLPSFSLSIRASKELDAVIIHETHCYGELCVLPRASNAIHLKALP